MHDRCDNAPDIIPLARVDQLRDAATIVRQEAAALEYVANHLDGSFCDAVDLISAASGSVIITGVGKAGLIGQKIVATMASTGTRSYFLHPTEAVHGDLGSVSANDVVLAFSNSGKSDEVIRLLPLLRRINVPVIAVTRDSENPLAQAARVVLSIGNHQEAGQLRLAPSVSTTAMLAIGDALSLVLSSVRGFTENDFAGVHPAGNLGMQLTPVHEVMRSGGNFRVALESETVREIMIELGRPGRRSGAVVLVDSDHRLTGVFTDSDLARLFEQRREHLMDGPISDVMTANPTTIGPDELLPEAVRKMSERKISELPVVDANDKPLGLVDITDLIDCSVAIPSTSNSCPTAVRNAA